MRSTARRAGSSRVLVLLAAAVMACIVPRGGAFLVAPPAAVAAGAAPPRQQEGGAVVAGGRREGLTRVAFQLDMGETEESSDFYNPQGIKEGDRVKVSCSGVRLYHIPKTDQKEGVDPNGLEGEVMSIKMTNKAGVMCSANRPVVVKFSSPYKFMGHFEFRELVLLK